MNQKHKKENMSRPANPAKPIVDALLQRFLPLAGRRIDTAQAQVFFGFVVVLFGFCSVLIDQPKEDLYCQGHGNDMQLVFQDVDLELCFFFYMCMSLYLPWK